MVPVPKETMVINLDRSLDRMAAVSKMLIHQGIEFERLTAIDGQALTSNERKANTNALCGTFCTAAQIGCAMSHFKAWRRIVENSISSALIFEDDAIIVDDFQKKLALALMEVPDNFDIVYVGCTTGCSPDGKPSLIERFLVQVSRISPKKLGKPYQPIAEHVYVPTLALGTHAYIISNTGARKLLRLSNGVSEGHIDTQIQSYARELNLFALTPILAFQRQRQSLSTIAKSAFPVLGADLLDGIQVNESMTMAYALSVPIGCVRSYMINGWTALFFILGLLTAIFNWNKYKLIHALAILFVPDLFIPQHLFSILVSSCLVFFPSLIRQMSF